MKNIKLFLHFILLLFVKVINYFIFNPDLGNWFKNKFQKDKNHFRIRGKRKLINDYIHEQAAKLPKMKDNQGNIINHVQDMKKSFREFGVKGIIKYINSINKIIRHTKYPNPFLRFCHNVYNFLF